MDAERIIDEIEQLQEMFEAPDIRPLSASDFAAANRRHDEQLANSPWFRLWQRYQPGVQVVDFLQVGRRSRLRDLTALGNGRGDSASAKALLIYPTREE